MLNETHHAFIVRTYFVKLAGADREAGTELFKLATQTYGEQRGRRMAARALRDGRSRGLAEYIAYCEWKSTPDFYGEVLMSSRPGHMDETVFGCPWAKIFAEHPMGQHCGRVYCAQIDKAVLRGFNPDLAVEVLQTQHDASSCEFDFQDDAADETLMEKADAIAGLLGDTCTLPLSYHCAHLLQAFHTAASNVLGPAPALELKRQVLDDFEKAYGACALAELASYNGADFLEI